MNSMDEVIRDPSEPEAHARRVAFFGGSFDPPHLGHLAVARAARDAFELDTILFAPVGAQPLKMTQPLKVNGSTASFDDRVELTRLAIADEPGFAVSLADAPKPSGAPNYTIDTLAGLRAQLPLDAALFCLMGADSFFGLRQWHRAAEIPFVAPLIVAARPPDRSPLEPKSFMADLKVALPAGLTIEPLPGVDNFISGPELRAYEVRTYLVRNSSGRETRLYLLPGLDIEISASEIREQVRGSLADLASGNSVLPRAVFEAIRARGLYR
jgi:nicotinate-nucleotide adenylyltransferase